MRASTQIVAGITRWFTGTTFVPALVALGACQVDRPSPTGVDRPDGSREVERTISDAVHSGGTAGFYFLPPMVQTPTTTGAFDADIAALNPEVVICETGASDVDCGGASAALVTFTTSTSPAITVDPVNQQYRVNWNTRDGAFSAGHTYRLHVRAGVAGARRELGFADIQLTDTPGQVKHIATGDVIVLNDGQTLPVKFRIETSIPGSLAVTVEPGTVKTGETAQATVTVLDLHGTPSSGSAVVWSSTGAPVTIAGPVGATGAGGQHSTGVTAGAVTGSAVITASSGTVSATAPLTVIPAIIDDAEVLANMNDPRSGSAVAAHDGMLYAFGGWRNSSPGEIAVNTVERYDPATDQWTYLTPLPTARRWAAAAVVDGVIYVIGGLGGPCCGTMSVVEAYDPATDTWTTKAPMLRDRAQFGVGIHNGIIYALGGWSPLGASETATVEAYDPVTNTWTPRTPMPMRRSGHAVATALGKFYVVGGEFESLPNEQGPTFEYDPATDTWATRAALPTRRVFLGAAAVGGIVYAVAGRQRAGGCCFATIEAYDPITDTWSTKSSLNIGRWAPGVGALNGAVYVVGGVLHTQDVPQLEVYRP